MEVTTKAFKRCDVVEVSGRIDSRTAPQLSDAVSKIIDAGRFRIVLDLEETNFVSSAGLRVFLDAQKTCKRWNRGHVVLCSVPDQIHNALDMVGFLPLFEIFDDLTEAVGSF